jgi:dienelactone hydrolase
LIVVSLALIVLTCPGRAAESAPGLAATWRKAHVAIPATDGTLRPVIGTWSNSRVQGVLAALRGARPLPAIVYMHGCSGIGGEEEASKLFFMEQGYAVFLPDSFARPGRRSNCNLLTRDRALAPESHDLRLAELRYAVEQLRDLPWIDRRRIYIVGFSEGGLAAARYERGDVAGIVIMSWHCQGAPPFVGIRAPRAVAVLAILGAEDPWYRGNRGHHCGKVFHGRAEATSLVLEGNGHEIINSPDLYNAARAKGAILDFLARH